MKILLFALFAVAMAVPVPDDDEKLYISEKTIYDTRLSPVVSKPRRVEYKSMEIHDVSSDDDVYVTLSEPKRYVEVKKPIIKEPVYKRPILKEIVYKKPVYKAPVYKAPVIEYEVKEAKVVTPEFRTVPTMKTYSRPVLYKQPIYYED